MEARMKELLDIIATFVKERFGLLADRITALEKLAPQKGERGEKGIDGKDGVDGKNGADGKDGANGKDAIDGKDGADGKSVEPAEVKATLAELVAALPKPADGKDGRDGASVDMVVVRGIIAEMMAALPPPKDGKDGADGKSVELTEVKALLEELVAALSKPVDGKDGVDGKDAPPVDVEALKAELVTCCAELTEGGKLFLATELSKMVAALPVPKDGADGKDAPAVDEAAIEARIAERYERRFEEMRQAHLAAMGEMVAKAVAALPAAKDGRDGQDAPQVDVDAVVEAVVEKCKAGLVDSQRNNFTVLSSQLEAKLGELVAALPAPKDGLDGKSVNPADVERELHKLFGEWAPAVTKDLREHAAMLFAALPKAKDGVDGKDGKSVVVADVEMLLYQWLDANFSKWALSVERRVYETAEKAIAAMPKPKDGVDGVGLQAFELDGRVLKFTRADGEVVEDVLPIPIHCGVWDMKKVGGYQKNDWVTFGGSVFMAMKDTDSKPETDDSWRLVIKRGRDGKNARNIS